MSFRFTEIEVGIVMLLVDAISGQDKAAMHSISTTTSSGRRATSTVARAGLCHVAGQRSRMGNG